MNILIINITRNWVYRLYEEYIISIKNFILENYYKINIDILFFEIINFNNENLLNINFNKYNKIFYTGDLEILKYITFIINYDFNKLYFINIEQMSHPSYYKMIRNVDTNINIIDYSEENIPYFKDIYKNVFLFPPYFKENLNSFNKNIDVLSITNNEYRNNILKNIYFNSNLKILFLDNCYGEIRDKYFAESKIYINIHCSNEHKTMELIRIANLIMNKVIVISEKSVFEELLFLKKYIIICNDLNNLNKFISDILTNYNDIYNKIYYNFDYNEYKNYIKENVNHILV
jgi:hypothetical protein